MKVPPTIKEELEGCGVPFNIERGTRHFKIFVGGALCGIFPVNGKAGYKRAELNVRAQIRRRVRECLNL